MDARQRALSALSEAEANLSKLSEIHRRLREATSELGRLFGQSSALAAEVVKARNSKAELAKAIENMQEAQVSFDLHYRRLQSQMQKENRSYTAVSNVMKTRHDTAKNSISNIR